MNEELTRRKLTEVDLAARRKGNAEKVAFARRLRAETAMTLKWIADNLKMGIWARVAHV